MFCEITEDLYVITTALIKTNDFRLPYINIPVETIKMNFNNKEKVDPGEKEKKYLLLLFWLTL